MGCSADSLLCRNLQVPAGGRAPLAQREQRSTGASQDKTQRFPMPVANTRHGLLQNPISARDPCCRRADPVETKHMPCPALPCLEPSWPPSLRHLIRRTTGQCVSSYAPPRQHSPLPPCPLSSRCTPLPTPLPPGMPSPLSPVSYDCHTIRSSVSLPFPGFSGWSSQCDPRRRAPPTDTRDVIGLARAQHLCLPAVPRCN